MANRPHILPAQFRLPKLLAAQGAAPRLYVPDDIIGGRYFPLAVAAAVLLHAAVAAVWLMLPGQEIIDVPVRVLNVKLSDGNAAEMDIVRKSEPGADNQKDVENALTRLVRDETREAARAQSVIASMEKAMNDASGEQMVRSHLADGGARQFVRAPAQSLIPADGVEMVSRYEQMLSLWIQKFKIYPQEARDAGLEGETLVRLRIDRRGNVKSFVLEHSTGQLALDRAAIDMVKRANPVPAVPKDYPAGELFEFLVPVSFRLQ